MLLFYYSIISLQFIVCLLLLYICVGCCSLVLCCKIVLVFGHVKLHAASTSSESSGIFSNTTKPLCHGIDVITSIIYFL